MSSMEEQVETACRDKIVPGVVMAATNKDGEQPDTTYLPSCH